MHEQNLLGRKQRSMVPRVASLLVLLFVAGGGLFYLVPHHAYVLPRSLRKVSSRVKSILNNGTLLFVAERVVINNDQWVIVHPEMPDDQLLQDLRTSIPERVKGKTLIFCNNAGLSAILRIIYEQSEVNSMAGDSDDAQVRGLVRGLSPPPLPGIIPSGTVTAVVIGDGGNAIDGKTSDLRQMRFECGRPQK